MYHNPMIHPTCPYRHGTTCLLGVFSPDHARDRNAINYWEKTCADNDYQRGEFIFFANPDFFFVKLVYLLRFLSGVAV